MTYRLKFIPSAFKEWKKLDPVLQKQFKKKLTMRLQNPVVDADRLSGQRHFFKIKLRQSGYRLIYEVENESITVWVLAIGKRERGKVYQSLDLRKKPDAL